MSSRRLEAFLARIYVDAPARERFLADPLGEAQRAGLDPDECDAVQKMDHVGLEMAARSFERKRFLSRKRLQAEQSLFSSFRPILRIIRRKLLPD